MLSRDLCLELRPIFPPKPDCCLNSRWFNSPKLCIVVKPALLQALIILFLSATGSNVEFHTFNSYHCKSRPNATNWYNDMAVLVFNPQGFKLQVGMLG